jgi:hypothetical protein
MGTCLAGGKAISSTVAFATAYRQLRWPDLPAEPAAGRLLGGFLELTLVSTFPDFARSLLESEY